MAGGEPLFGACVRGCIPTIWMVFLSTAAADTPAVVVLAEGYRKTIQSFPVVSVEYTITRGTAMSLEQITGETPVNIDVIAAARWVVEGDRERREIDYPAEQRNRFVRKLPGGQEVRENLPRVVICNEKAIAVYHPMTRQAVIDAFQSQSALAGAGYSMFGFGEEMRNERHHKLFTYVAHLDSKEISVAAVYHGIEEVMGRKTHKVSFGPSAAEQKDYFWIDAERGFIPIQHELWEEKDEVSTRVYVVDIASVSGGRWLPTRIIHLWGRKSPFKFVDIHASQWDAEKPPAEKEFTLTLAPGTLMRNELGGKSFKVTGERPVVFSLDQATAHMSAGAATKAAQGESEGDYFPPDPQPRASHWWWVGGVLAILGVVAVAVVWRRLQR